MKKEKSEKLAVSFSMKKELMDYLDWLASETGVNRSAIVNYLIETMIHETAEHKAKKDPKFQEKNMFQFLKPSYVESIIRGNKRLI